MSSRFREGSARFAERRQREREAPRLRAEVPELSSLRLEVEEQRSSTTVPESKHVRHVVVDHAPALFVLMCGDSSCRDGGHDITHMMLRHLQHGETEFEVEDPCSGSVGMGQCGRVMYVRARATYATAEAPR
jgi:hypothetical protein